MVATETNGRRPAADVAPDSLLLPEGTRLVHIGPHKTGTTTLQAAFHAARDEMARQGVHYTGRRRQPMSAVLAVTGRPSPDADEGSPPSLGKWRRLVREVKEASEPRVVVSSEFFADAEPQAIRRVVEDLGGDQVHVAVTLRPLAKIIPSQWQQYVQSGMRTSMDRWLKIVLSDDPGRISPTFWRRHRHDHLIRRWMDVVGPERMTAVVVDDRDHDRVLRVFEEMVGLTDGLLVADRDLSNRSMTLPEIQIVRAFNRQFSAAGFGRGLHTRVMRFGAALYMKERVPGRDELKVVAPQWALDRAGEVAEEMVSDIRATGVRIVGDLDVLTAVPEGRPRGKKPDVRVDPDVAARAAMGVLVALARANGEAGVPGTTSDIQGVLANVPTAELARALRGRAGRRLGRGTRSSES